MAKDVLRDCIVILIVLLNFSCRQPPSKESENTGRCLEIATDFCKEYIWQQSEKAGPVVSNIEFTLKTEKGVVLSTSPNIVVNQGSGLTIPPNTTEITRVEAECIAIKHPAVRTEKGEQGQYSDFDIAVTATITMKLDSKTNPFAMNETASYRFSGIGDSELAKIAKVEACWAK